MKQYRKKVAQPKLAMGQRKARLVANTIIYIILTIMMIVWILPFVFLLFESLRVESTWQVGYIFPQQWGFDNYINLFNGSDSNITFLRWYVNTFVTAVFTAIFQTIFVLAMSYTLSRLRFKGRKFLMNFMLVLGMFPGFLSMILLYKVFSWANMTQGPSDWYKLFFQGSVPSLVIVYCASSGMGYYVSKGYFDTIPRSLDEAARVDGANRFQVFYKIIIPLSKPIVIYTILTGFMGPWGDFMFASYIAHGNKYGYNVASGIQNMIGTDSAKNARYTMFCAAGVLVAIPVTTLFMFLQRYYVEGVTGGAVKG